MEDVSCRVSAAQALHILFQRVARNVEPQDFLFGRQALRLGPLGHIRHF